MLELIRSFGGLVNTSFAIVIGIALVVFLWGLAKFIFRVGGDEKAVDSGRTLMIWGVVALFVMVSVWGIVAFFEEAFGLPKRTMNTQSPASYPTPELYSGPLQPFEPFRTEPLRVTPDQPLLPAPTESFYTTPSSGGGSTIAPQPLVSIFASETRVPRGSSFTLSWSSSHSQSCRASGGWSGSKSVSGSENLSLSQRTTYTLTCIGLGGSDVRSVTVDVF